MQIIIDLNKRELIGWCSGATRPLWGIRGAEKLHEVERSSQGLNQRAKIEEPNRHIRCRKVLFAACIRASLTFTFYNLHQYMSL